MTTVRNSFTTLTYEETMRAPASGMKESDQTPSNHTFTTSLKQNYYTPRLRQKIGGMLFQRTALSKRPTSVISAEISKLRDGQMSPDTVFRDPYLLDLLGLKGAYSERDLESAILREIEGVLLELGTGFAFVARQKRMSVGKDDFHLDLLFFHRHLRRLIAVELKLESFQPAHFYWLLNSMF